MSMYDVWRRKRPEQQRAWGSFEDWLEVQLEDDPLGPLFLDEVEEREVEHLRQRLALHSHSSPTLH